MLENWFFFMQFHTGSEKRNVYDNALSFALFPIFF